MATTVAPETTTNGKPTTSFGDLSWLDTEHEIFKKNKYIWAREERRHIIGMDGLLEELVRWDGESDDSFNTRKTWAKDVPFGKAHVSAITGELSRKRPMPGKGLSFGKLGDIRARDAIDTPTRAELGYYNFTGVGDDGSEFPAFMDDVDIRAQITGHRLLMVEHSDTAGKEVSVGAWVRGKRPYGVERSPRAMPNWYISRGEFQFAVFRIPIDEPRVENGAFVAGQKPGYYLLVRQGFQGLGSVFAGGGWWKFDSDKKFINSGTWQKTRGRIPLIVYYGEASDGTEEWPSMSRSSTAGFGQIQVGLMNITSARDGNFWDGCSPLTLILGGEPATMKALADQLITRSIYAALPYPEDAKGDLKPITIHESAMGIVPAEVAKAIVDAKFAEAREESFQKITSTPDSSGASKEAGHAENKAPLLARRARYRQQAEQSLIQFFELRAGVPNPSGYSRWTTDYDLKPLVDQIDAAFDTLRRSGLNSKTAAVTMVMTAFEERGIVNDANRATFQSELEGWFDQKEADAAAAREATKALGGGGFPET